MIFESNELQENRRLVAQLSKLMSKLGMEAMQPLPLTYSNSPHEDSDEAWGQDSVKGSVEIE